MTDENQSFIQQLMETIIEAHKIPKVQVERIISPILSLFIADLITKQFENHESLSGIYELVTIEFPLKKEESAQSVNVDFLLVNSTRKLLIFLELKTESYLRNGIQLKNYLRLRDKIGKQGAQFLFDDIELIRSRSARNSKYTYLLTKISEYIDFFKDARALKIIYLVPTKLKENKLLKEVDSVIPLTELASTIGIDAKTPLALVLNSLQSLDREITLSRVRPKKVPRNPRSNYELRKNDILKQLSAAERAKISHNINDFCLNGDSTKPLPDFVRIGLKGEGFKPNYQIEFTKEGVIPFHNSGAIYKRSSSFAEENLSDRMTWREFTEWVAS